jgi:hypothetical protein
MQRFLLLFVIGACGGSRASSTTEVVEPPQCPIQMELSKQALAATNQVALHPDDRAARGALLIAAAKFAAYAKNTTQKTDNQCTVTSMTAEKALLPYLQQAVGAATSCEDKLLIGRIMFYVQIWPVDLDGDGKFDEPAEHVFTVDARACLSAGDVALPRQNGAPAVCWSDETAMIGELWPRARAGERLVLLDSAVRCNNNLFLFSSTPEEDARAVPFLSAEEFALYLPGLKQRHAENIDRDLASMGANVGVEGAIHEAVEACNGQCLDRYGEGGSTCMKSCVDSSCGVCQELFTACSRMCEAP